jgi:transcriptional regulator with XRE-family HTH domain
MANDELSLLIEGRTAANSGRSERLREAAGLTQADLARLVGVTAAAVSRWEAGLRTPRGTSAIAYAKALRRVEEMIERRVAA